jgi:hypothetical protein
MKKYLALLLVATLAFGIAGGSAAAKKKKKKKAKPVETTLYMHGPSQFGEVDGVEWFAGGGAGMSPLTLDTNEPGAGQPKSMNYFSPPFNDQCTGLPLAFPTFNGDVTGTIVGDATLKLNFLSAPATGVLARIWADVPPFSACNDAYIEPASEVAFDIPAGRNEVEVVFEDLNLKSQSFVLIEVLAMSGADWRGQTGRLLYDSADAASSFTFNCLPAKGTSCTP